MNKLLDFASRLTPQTNLVESISLEDKSEVVPSNSQLLDYIYAVDPVTAMPSGDLAIYLGDKANPEVRQFIELNLLQEHVDGKSAMNLPDEVINKMKGVINDDDIAFFSRNHDESREEYADRLKLFFLKEKEIRAQKRKLQEIEQLSKKKKND